jgi:hypothetical protein
MRLDQRWGARSNPRIRDVEAMDVRKLDHQFDAIGDEFGRGYRIVDRNNPEKTPNLLSGLNPSLQETRDRLAKFKAGKLRDRDKLGRYLKSSVAIV